VLEYIDVLGVVVPELLPMKNFTQNNKHHIYDVLTHTAITVDNTPRIFHLRLAALLHDIGKPHTYSEDDKKEGHFYGHPELSVKIASDILDNLKVSNFIKERILTLIKYHDAAIEPAERAVKRWLNKLAPEIFAELIALKRADNLAQSPDYRDRQELLDELEIISEKIISENACFSLKDLAIKGDDLIALGVKQGKEIGVMLDRLLLLVIDEKISNDIDELLGMAKSLIR